MKKIFVAGLKCAVVILAIRITFLIIAIGIYLTSIVIKRADPIQIRADIEPIYNHFPDLPETSEMQWCSKSSGGVGLTTTYVYIFAFYDSDISKELQEMKITDKHAEPELYFVPDKVDENQKWKHAEDVIFAFQNGMKDTQKMHTDVYINETGTILYIEAVGD